MNSPAFRAVISRGVIALAILAGGYFFFVEPRERELAQVQAQVAHAQGERSQRDSQGLSIAQLRDLDARAQKSAAGLKRRNAPAADEAALFESIMKLAGDTSVRVESMNPAGRTTAAPPPAPAAGATSLSVAPGARDSRTQYSLQVQGGFENLIAFIEALQRDMGYTGVRSLRIAPINTPGTNLVQATIETEHAYFDLGSMKAPAEKKP
ncbi:hypothetical protein BH11PLA1_BH11PLA1_16860 [soil metagenome]